MNSEEFEAEAWNDRLARALRGLSRTQGPFLPEYWRHNPREHVVIDGRDETPFPPNDLRTAHALANHEGSLGEQATTHRYGW